jgi:hypothetical protein
VGAEAAWLWWTVAGAAIALALLGLWILRKNRLFTAGDVFRASRLSRGNRLFPTQVLITPSTVVHFTPRWVGKQEESIHITHIASVKIHTHLLFSNVLIETTGGANPIHCYGHPKRDAVIMKSLIERYQNDYYRQAPPPRPASSPVAGDPLSR